VSTSEQIAAAEREVGEAFATELASHVDLAGRLTDSCGRLIDRVKDAPGEMSAIHVCAILLARLITDLQAVVHLIRRGYAAPALSLTAGLFEMAYMLMYIGADEERAEKWAVHADSKRASPWSVKTTIEGVAQSMGADEKIVEREYEGIYRDVNMAKHGNPMAIGDVGLIATDEGVLILAGPHLSNPTRRWARTAMSHANQYVRLAAMRFYTNHVLRLPGGDELSAGLIALSDEARRLHDVDVVVLEELAKRAALGDTDAH
jgi:hypothetical protein